MIKDDYETFYKIKLKNKYSYNKNNILEYHLVKT